MKKFTVIRGGKAGELANAHGRSKKSIFRDIEVAFRMATHASFGPAFGKAVAVFLTILFGLTGLIEGVERLSIMPRTSSYVVWLFSGIALVVAFLVYRRHPYRSWSQKLYALLAEYEPTDKAAYARLQTSARDFGLTREAMIAWLHSESRVLNRPGGSANDRPRDRFLNKRT